MRRGESILLFTKKPSFVGDRQWYDKTRMKWYPNTYVQKDETPSYDIDLKCMEEGILYPVDITLNIHY